MYFHGLLIGYVFCLASLCPQALDMSIDAHGTPALSVGGGDDEPLGRRSVLVRQMQARSLMRTEDRHTEAGCPTKSEPRFFFGEIAGHCTGYGSYKRYGVCSGDDKCQADASCVTSLEECKKYCDGCSAIAWGDASWRTGTDKQCVVYYDCCTDSGAGTTTWGLTYYAATACPVRTEPRAVWTAMAGHCTGYGNHKRFGVCSGDDKCQADASCVTSLEECKKECDGCSAIAWGDASWRTGTPKHCIVYYEGCTDSGAGTTTWGLTYYSAMHCPVMSGTSSYFNSMVGHCKAGTFGSYKRYGVCVGDANCQADGPCVTTLDECKTKCDGCSAIAWGTLDGRPATDKHCVVYWSGCTDSGAGTTTWGLTYYAATSCPARSGKMATFSGMAGHCTGYGSFKRYGSCSGDSKCQTDAGCVNSLDDCKKACDDEGCSAIAWGDPDWRTGTDKQCIVYYAGCTDSGAGTTTWGMTYYAASWTTTTKGTDCD